MRTQPGDGFRYDARPGTAGEGTTVRSAPDGNRRTGDGAVSGANDLAGPHESGHFE
jgi:hypothetical protein